MTWRWLLDETVDTTLLLTAKIANDAGYRATGYRGDVAANWQWACGLHADAARNGANETYLGAMSSLAMFTCRDTAIIFRSGRRAYLTVENKTARLPLCAGEHRQLL